MQGSPIKIQTPRLELIAADAVLARADAQHNGTLAVLLACDVPPSWPPEVLLDVRDHFAQKLEESPGHHGWWNWYAVQKNPRVLVGSGGFNGPPDAFRHRDPRLCCPARL